MTKPSFRIMNIFENAEYESGEDKEFEEQKETQFLFLGEQDTFKLFKSVKDMCYKMYTQCLLGNARYNDFFCLLNNEQCSNKSKKKSSLRNKCLCSEKIVPESVYRKFLKGHDYELKNIYLLFLSNYVTWEDFIQFALATSSECACYHFRDE